MHVSASPSPVSAATASSSLPHRFLDQVTTHGIRIAIIVVAAVLVRWALHRLINRVTTATAEGAVPIALRPLADRAAARLREVRDGSLLLSERRRQRAETVGSVLRSVASFGTAAIAFVLILGELGIQLGPIIAGAGVAGVALGFGAQNLVKDFIAGIFMMLEDQYGVGDSVDLGQASGTVEAVGLRTTRLRDLQGTVWYCRNGEVLRVGNKSQGYAQVVLDIPISYTTDLDLASTVIGDVGTGLAQDDQWSDKLLSEPELLGVEQITPDAVILRMTVQVENDEAGPVARELRARLKRRFDAESIDSPYAGSPVYVRADRSVGPAAPTT